MNQDPVESSLIAPCGMNCGICLGYLRRKNHCPGCNSPDPGKPGYCATCIIKTCGKRALQEIPYCCACSTYACARLKRLDKRYRTRYGMSMVENLALIQTQGLAALVERESTKWICSRCGERLCVHRSACLSCSQPNPYYPARETGG